MSRNTAESYDHTGMLDRIIFIKKSGAHGTHILTLTKSQHFFYKILCDQFNIIVHEQQILTVRILHTKIIDRRVIELPLPVHHMHLRKLFLDLLIIFERLRVCAVVFYDDKLQVLIGSFCQHRSDAVVKIQSMILIRNDHRHQRITDDLKCRVINAVIHAFFHFLCSNSHTVIMSHDRAGTGLECVKFAFRIAGR